MSRSDAADAATQSREFRTVTPSYLGRPDMEMDVIGWVVFCTLLVVLLPVLPFVAVFWLVSKALDFFRRQTA